MKLTTVVFTLFFFLVNPVYLNSSSDKDILRNISTLGYEPDETGKSWIDAKTRYKISTCSESYDLIKQLGINTNRNEPACAKTDYYEGSCWVTNLGFTGGNYKAEVCYQPPLGYAQCKVLSSGESSGKFSLEMRDLSYTNPYYTGSFKTKDEQECPNYTNNINALGYVYIKEATDEQYTDAVDFANKFCQPLAEKYNPNNCSSPQTCPCDDEECRANNFIPPNTSEVWKKSTQKAKNCYLCLQQYRAVNFYCNKIYQCLNKDKKSYAYELAKSEYKKYIDDIYGEGSYLCGYYDGKLCGCGKSKLSAGPRHFLRVARKTSSYKCETKEDLIANPQCNLFRENIYVRQFYNDRVNHADSDCPFKSLPELGYKKRGTFFSPKITIVSGKNERLIGYNSSLLLGNEEYYYNKPIGTSIEYSENNRYAFPTAKKILFSNFYPVIFTIGALDEIKDENGKCLLKPNGDISYVMLRLEYNFSTGESALVAYKVRFLNDSPSQLVDGKSLLSDGSISKFIISDNTFINAIKNAKESSTEETMNELEFKYDFDPNPNFENKKMQENGRYLYFENIGKVARPPLKYSYDEGSIYINTPILLEEDLSANSSSYDTREKRLKISLIPSKLSSFEGDEFEYDKQLSPVVKQISIAGYSKDAFNLSSDDIITNKSSAGIAPDAIMYMKRFSAKYNNSCVFLKAMNDPGQEEYLLTNPPRSITECSGISSLEKKMACLVSFISLYECNGYVNCLDDEKSIAECQSENRRPKIKLLGSDSDLPEYKKNIDFRSYTQICVDEGFEFADKLSDYSNTKLFGDFGYAPYDYTIRWKKSSTGISSSTPGRPLSIRYRNSINEPEEYQDRPKDIITMDIDYFSSRKSDRSINMIERLNGVHMINNANGMPSNVTAYQQYASDCGYNMNICKDRYEVKHRLVNETLGTLCVSSGSFNNGEWDLKSRDFGIDYNIYVPLRCQYVFFNGVGAGGAGFTTEKNSNCLVQYWVTENSWYFDIPFPKPLFFSPAYLRTPKFDATGSQGGYVTAKINLNSFPVFDGYLSVTVGSRTLFSRSQIDGKSDSDPEKCFLGASPHHNIDRNTGDWMVRGGTHGFWFLNYDSLIKISGDKAYLNNPPKQGISDIEKYYDYRKGNSEIAFDTHGADVSSFDEKEYITSIYEVEKRKLEGLIESDSFVSLIKENQKYRLIEFYLVALMHLSYRLQYADNALFEAQNIALVEIRKKYEAELLKQKNDKKSKENERIVLQSQLDGMSRDIDECKNIDPDTGRTVSGKTQEECDEISHLEKMIKDQIEQLDIDISAIQQEIERLEIIINNNDYPDDEIRNFDISTSVMKDNFTSIIDSINSDINSEKNSWISEMYPSEPRAVVNEDNEIKDLEDNYKITNVEKLNEVIDRYIESIRFVSNEKKLYCNNLSSISATNIIDVENIKRFYEEKFIDIMTNHLDLFNEFQEEKRLIKELYLSCKQHTNDLIELSIIKPEKYADKIEFRHSNDYGLLKSLMCLTLDVNSLDCEEQNSINSHNKIQNSSNLCEATKIIQLYNNAKEKLYRGRYVGNKETICYRTDCEVEEDEDGNKRSICGKDSEDEEDSDDCREGDNNCKCEEVEYSETERMTDKSIDLNSKQISDKLEAIQNQISAVEGLEAQLEAIDESESSATDSNYQYLATALRGSSPIDARIKRKRQGKDNVPYWDGEHTLTGTTTSFQANLFGKTIDGRKCYKTGLYDVAYKHDYICLHKKGWIEGKRKIVLNDGYGYANKNYTFSDAFSNERNLKRSSTLSTELDHRAMLGSYEKYEGMSGDGSGSVNDHNAVKGKWNLYSTDEKEGAGGSFHHLQGAGGGGPGSVEVNLTSIGVDQFEYNGETYPKLNDDGTKKVVSGNYPDRKCIIKCPPMNVLIKDFEFYFQEIQKTAPIDMVCEYSGEPEHDMEATVGTTVVPKKCYIVTESVAGVGDVKGKIIISSDGVCPITKCAYGSWGTSAQPNTRESVAQYDRNTGICKPRDQYGDEKKSSKYFMMMFDKNVYSGLAYVGSRTAALSASLPQYINGKWKFNSYTIARCSDTKISGYIIDTYDQLSAIGKKCSDSGFWSDYNSVTVEPLFEERKYDAICMPDKDEYKICKISDASDEERKKEYSINNDYWNTKEYIVKDSSYILGKKNGNEFGKPKDGDITVSGVHSIDKKGIKIGRTVFKDRIKCPMLDADRYDFDKDYTGNAIWDFADEHSGKVTAIRCKKNAIQIGNSLPTRACKVNGLWGPVMTNSCLVACEEKIENGIRWVVTSDDMTRIKENQVEIYGACSSNYLNSQEYRGSNETTRRVCNLLSSTWGPVQGANECKDGLICINDNYDKKIVSTPYARTMIFTKSNQYKELINELNNSGKSKLDDITEYNDGLYLNFEQGKKHSSIFDSDYYQANNDYIDVKIEEKNFDVDGSAYITDKNGHRLVNRLANNDYYVISVYNTMRPDAFPYMIAKGKNERNEFLNIENWLSILNKNKMNFTGQWKWKANLSMIRSTTVMDSTKQAAQEIYKNARLYIFIPKLIDNNSNLQHIALFSPYLAKTMGAGSNIVPAEDENIKFRYMLDISEDYLIANEPYAMTVYDGISSSSRLYRFEWDKGDNDDFGNIIQTTHKIGSRNCNGKYFGFIKHNTTKHIMYTPEPTSSNQLFASLYCYDGRIFGFHAFRSNILQDETLTDNNTKNVLLSRDANGYNGAMNSYEFMKSYFNTLDLNNDYFSDDFDNYREGAKNAYLFAMMAKYWQAHIMPTEEEQSNFIEYYRPDEDINYERAANRGVKEVLKRYAEGNQGYYYRILPRRVDWINGTKSVAIDSVINIYDVAKIDDDDPYCLKTNCIQQWKMSDDLNEIVNEENWEKCDEKLLN